MAINFLSWHIFCQLHQELTFDAMRMLSLPDRVGIPRRARPCNPHPNVGFSIIPRSIIYISRKNQLFYAFQSIATIPSRFPLDKNGRIRIIATEINL